MQAINNVGTKIVMYLKTNGFNIDCSATNSEGERQKTLICVQYTHNQKTRFIPLHVAQDLEKWTRRAITRRRFLKFMNIKAIANLRYPRFEDDKIEFSDEPLFSDEDLALILDFDQEGANRRWNNNWIDVGDGNLYQGQWKVSFPKNTIFMMRNDFEYEGIGTIKFADGSLYQGQFRDMQFNGKGRLTHSNGDIVQGEWVDGKANGFGVLIDQEGAVYKGQMQDDKYHGHGIETWDFNRARYEGQFVQGEKTGKGKFEFEENCYEGDFVSGLFHGQGKYYFAETGKVYEGQMKNNAITGQGVMTWPDNSMYQGQFVNGKMEGKGVKVWSNGTRYEGIWKNDNFHGDGSLLQNIPESDPQVQMAGDPIEGNIQQTGFDNLGKQNTQKLDIRMQQDSFTDGNQNQIQKSQTTQRRISVNQVDMQSQKSKRSNVNSVVQSRKSPKGQNSKFLVPGQLNTSENGSQMSKQVVIKSQKVGSPLLPPKAGNKSD